MHAAMTDSAVKFFRAMLPEGLKVRETITRETDWKAAIAFLCYDPDWCEYQVWVWYIDKTRNHADQVGQYHTDCTQDARETAARMLDHATT